MTPDTITPDLKTVLRRLRLSPILATLPERLSLAREQSMPHQDFLLLVLGDEVSRRDSEATTSRARRAQLDMPRSGDQRLAHIVRVPFDCARRDVRLRIAFQPGLDARPPNRSRISKNHKTTRTGSLSR